MDYLMISNYEQKIYFQKFLGMAMDSSHSVLARIFCLVYGLFRSAIWNDGQRWKGTIFLLGAVHLDMGAFPFFMGGCALDCHSQRTGLPGLRMETQTALLYLALSLALLMHLLLFFRHFQWRNILSLFPEGVSRVLGVSSLVVSYPRAFIFPWLSRPPLNISISQFSSPLSEAA